MSKSLEQPDRLQGACYALWLTLLFILPFEKFVALKHVLMAALLLAMGMIIRRDGARCLRAPNCQAVAISGLLVIILCLFSSLAGPYPVESLHGLRRDLLLQLELLICGWLLANSPDRAWAGFAALLAGFAAVSLLSSSEVLHYLSMHRLDDGPIPRSHSSFWSGYAGLAGVCLPLAIACIYSARCNLRWRLALLVLIATGMALLLLYGSRSPLIAVIGGVIALLALKGYRKSLLACIIAICTGGMVLGSQTSLGYFDTYRSLAKIDTYVSNKGLSARGDVWSGMLEVIAERPLLGYGYGWKKLATVINENGHANRWEAEGGGKAAYFLGESGKAGYGRVNPHNYPLQVIFEIGLLGFGAVVLFWMAVLRLALKDMYHPVTAVRQINLIILVTLVAYWISNLANGYWVGNIANIACSLVGILVGTATSEKR